MDMHSDLIGELTGMKNTSKRIGGISAKPKIPLPSKRGGSMNPARLKTSSAVDLVSLGMKSV